MKNVAKYNLCKGASTVATFGAPLGTLFACGDFIVQRPSTSISAAGVFAIILLLFFFKDKIAENFKIPPAGVLCLALFIVICLVEKILLPIKIVCLVTMVTSGIDEFTFKRIYKSIEQKLPTGAADYKHLGFIFSTTDKIEGGGK